MNKIVLFSKISINYWLHHKKRLFVFLITVVLGCVALYSSGLMIQSNKQAQLDTTLNNTGDYEYTVYDIPPQDAAAISALEQAEDHGLYYRLGYVISDNDMRTGAACFEDKHSEELYHLLCSDGHYPENENEIAVDKGSARFLGINPVVGHKVRLRSFSYSDSIIDDKEYTISGIFEASDSNLYGGWRRYPIWMEESEFEMPGIFFHSAYKDKIPGCNVTEFIQSNDAASLEKAVTDIFPELAREQHSITLGRKAVYSQILGLSTFKDGSILAEKYGGVTLENTIKAMKNGDVNFDFYSGVLMPVFSVLIGIIVIISIFGIAVNIVKDKQESFAVLRCLGLENKSLMIYVIVDFMLMTLLCIIAGLALGAAVHMGMIAFLNGYMGMTLVSGYECSELVAAATRDPFLITVLVISVSVLVSVIIVPLKNIGRSPISLFNTESSRGRKRHSSKRIVLGSWKRLISRRIKMHSHSAAVIAVIVMSAGLFGFTYFHALAVKDNGTIADEKEMYGLTDWDYTARLANLTDMYVFGIESRHDRGVDPEKLEELANNSFVEDSLGKMVSRSTRVSYKSDELDSNAKSLWREFDLRDYAVVHEGDDFEAALHDAENAMIRAIGYGDDEEVFTVPSTGLSEKELKTLEDKVVDGKIDIDRLNSGEEVLIAVSRREAESFGDMFKAGDTIPLSDVLLSDEDDLDFSTILPADIKEPVYKKNVVTDEGDEIELSSYAFGQRHNISTKVGAVLILDDEQADRYLYFAGERHYGINILCTFEEFRAWGLPNRNLTDMSIKVDYDTASIKEADESWFSAISNAKGMTFSSTSDITEKVVTGTRRTMSVYYCMMAVLILLSGITTAIILYSSIRIKSSKFAVMRACGMSVGQIAYLVIRHNMIYPIIGTVFSLIPTTLCNWFLKSIAEKIASGEWSVDFSSGEDPWYFKLPYFEDLFDYNVPQAMVLIFLIYVFVMLAVTLPQMYFISERSITAELEKSDF